MQLAFDNIFIYSIRDKQIYFTISIKGARMCNFFFRELKITKTIIILKISQMSTIKSFYEFMNKK